MFLGNKSGYGRDSQGIEGKVRVCKSKSGCRGASQDMEEQVRSVGAS